LPTPLLRPVKPEPNRYQIPQRRKDGEVDIAMIGAAAFKTHLSRPDTEIFTISLYEIDRAIEERKKGSEGGFVPRRDDESEEQFLRRTVLKEYYDLIDVFSKTESDKLSPHRLYDHKIELTSENNLGYTSLRQHTPEELAAMKKYITENLQKGFLQASSALFAAPVLFARKGDGSLRFCIDYRRLNLITKKDRYLLPLLKETFSRLSKAKVFTKIDLQ